MVLVLGIATFGLLVGIFSATFGLGGGLLVVPLMVTLGYDIKAATATSLAVIIPAAISGMLRELPAHRVVWELVLWLALGASLGACLGIFLKDYLGSQALRRAFGVVLVVMAFDLMQLKVQGVELTLRNLLPQGLSVLTERIDKGVTWNVSVVTQNQHVHTSPPCQGCPKEDLHD